MVFRIPDVAHQQDGVFTRSQALESGIAHSTLRRALSDGRLVEVGRGVFASASAPDSFMRRIRAAALTTDAVVSHWSAALVLGLDHDHPTLVAARRDPSSTPLHLTTSPTRSRRPPAAIEHRLQLDPNEVRVRHGIRVTDVQRTCLDLLALLPDAERRSLAFRAKQQRWLEESDVRRGLDRRAGWTGTPGIVDVLPIFSEDAHSEAEWLLLQILKSLVGIDFALNVAVTCSNGERCVLDAVIRGLRLALEVDGRAYHGRDRFNSDRRRQNALVADGWTVLRFTWDDLTHRPREVARVITETVARLRAAA
jgi:very-short-patch-repair endonuclease